MPKVKAVHQLVVGGEVIKPGKVVNIAKEHLERFLQLGAVTLVTGEVAEEAVVEAPVVAETVAEAPAVEEPAAEDKPAKASKSKAKANDDLV